MKFIDTAIADVKIIEPAVFGDERGFFMETFRADEFMRQTDSKPFVQDNHSKSAKGILRGLHYQQKQTQGKLVRVTSGAVYDVAVDMRKSSPTFGKAVGVVLSAENYRQLWVPEGFAHGFSVLSEKADVIYKVSSEYSPEHEGGIIWNDPKLNIDWPSLKPIVSTSDSQLSLLENLDDYFV